MDGVAIGRGAADLFHEAVDQHDGDLIDAVVIVSVARQLVLGHFLDEIGNQAAFVTHDTHLAVFNRGKRIRGHRQAGNAAGQGP